MAYTLSSQFCRRKLASCAKKIDTENCFWVFYFWVDTVFDSVCFCLLLVFFALAVLYSLVLLKVLTCICCVLACLPALAHERVSIALTGCMRVRRKWCRRTQRSGSLSPSPTPVMGWAGCSESSPRRSLTLPTTTWCGLLPTFDLLCRTSRSVSFIPTRDAKIERYFTRCAVLRYTSWA